MRVSVIALPFAGKKTFFRILDQHGRSGSASGKRGGGSILTVHIPDGRLEALTRAYEPKKQTNAAIEFIDAPSLATDQSGKSVSTASLEEVRQADSACLLIRDFESATCPHPRGSVDGRRDLAFILNEFVITDLVHLGNVVARLRKTSAINKDRAEIAAVATLEKAIAGLEKEIPLREMEFNEQEAKTLAAYQLLSAKPLLVVLNVDASRTEDMDALTVQYAERFPNLAFTALCADLEAELAEMPAEEAAEFMAEMGLAESAFRRVLDACFELLGLQVFYTVGPTETHSWPLPRGSSAYDAAGVVHTDFQKGFIRAEVMPYAAFAEAPVVDTFKSQAVQQKKDYAVADGDIILFHFSNSK